VDRTQGARLLRARLAFETRDDVAGDVVVRRSRLDGFQGLCDLYIGDPAKAHDRLERSVATMNEPRDTVQRGINTSERVQDVRRELRPWRTEPFMADLDDHIHESLIG
jgi:hypothetical protein